MHFHSKINGPMTHRCRMLLENTLVRIKGQVRMTFIVPLGEGGAAGRAGAFQSFMKTSCPLPQPSMVHHFTQALEGRGASAGQWHAHRHVSGGRGDRGGQGRQGSW